MLDVLVVGGGPTGFLTALGLARAGVTVRLIEAEPAIVDAPRAAVHHWAVLDGLEALGIRAEAEAIGMRKQDYLYILRTTGERIAYDLSVLSGRTAFPYNIHLGQHQLAAIAQRHLRALGNATVEFGTRFVALMQDADGVTVTAESAAGREEIRARWVIGADGASSAVRKALGLDFEGMTWDERFVATDVAHDFEAAGYALTTLIIDARHGAVIVKLAPDGPWRCTYMEDGALPLENVMARLPENYTALLPGGPDYRLVRASPYRMHQRCVTSMRVGRALLIGDAAHVTNPTGGLGLTTGLFDCFALYPALASVILDGAEATVLDRYSEVRRRTFLEKTSPRAVANKRFIFHANGGGEALEAGLMHLRRMAAGPDYRREALGFVKTLETPLLGEYSPTS